MGNANATSQVLRVDCAETSVTIIKNCPLVSLCMAVATRMRPCKTIYLLSRDYVMTSYPLFRIFVSVLSTVLALSACGGGGSAETTPTAAATPAATDPVADSVAYFAIDGRLKLSPLGSLIYEAYPIALLKDGKALSDTAALIYPEGLDAHRAKYPDAWTQWRQSGSDVQVMQKDGSWKTFSGNNVQQPATATSQLAGIYNASSITSSPFLGSVIASTNYTFTSVGAVGRGEFVVGNTANVSAIATTPDKRGTYTVKGYKLSISSENGTKEEHAIVTEPDKPKYIFIDGTLYSLK